MIGGGKPKVPAGYDATTLNHWLWWKLRCFEAGGEEFQKLFESVIKRTNPEFMSIRPYGKIGDRKTDGLFFAKGVVFQVYSPDELTQAALKKKIREDLAGAVKHWKTALKKWIFVYNVRRGLPPDIPFLLNAEKAKYPKVKLEPLSSDELWERTRSLPLSKRCEILGPPVGYESSFGLPVSKADAKKLSDGRFVVVHDVLSPINTDAAMKALRPEAALGPPIHVRPAVPAGMWKVAAEVQENIVKEALDRSRQLLAKFAVFSLAPIPLAVHLGFLLSDRVEARLFQFDRDRASWSWRSTKATAPTVPVVGLLGATVAKAVDVVVRVSVSARVTPAVTRKVVRGHPVEIDVAVKHPDVAWLTSSSQVVQVVQAFRTVLANIRAHVPRCRRVHLFAAVPGPVAVALGQTINPRMNPPVRLYEYDHQRLPKYRHVLTLGGEGKT